MYLQATCIIQAMKVIGISSSFYRNLMRKVIKVKAITFYSNWRRLERNNSFRITWQTACLNMYVCLYMQDLRFSQCCVCVIVDYSILICYAMLLGELFLDCWRITIPSSSRHVSPWTDMPWGKDDTVLWKGRNWSPSNMASHLRRLV